MTLGRTVDRLPPLDVKRLAVIVLLFALLVRRRAGRAVRRIRTLEIAGAAPMLFLVSAGCAAQSLGDFAYAMDLEVAGPAPFYSVMVPRPVYEGVTRSDWGDLRVFNGAGEVVPHAFRPREAIVQAPAFSPPLFALHGRPGVEADRASVSVETRSDGTIVSVAPASRNAQGERELQGYMADLSAHKEAIRAVELERPSAAEPFVGKLTLEASDNLATWRTLAKESPVLSLTSAGVGDLKRLRIEFTPQKLKYLRLSWPARSPVIEIAAIKVQPSAARAEPEREWKSMSVVPAKENEYLLEPGGRFPADRLRLRLPQPNTVAQVDVLRRAASDSWRPLTRAIAYRLQAGDGEVTNPDIEIDPMHGDALLVRIDPRGGGIGQGRPAVEIGWVPHELVFAARGTGPFRLAYGSTQASPAAYRIDSLIPGYQGKPDSAASPALQVLPARTKEPTVVAGPSALQKPIDAKRWALWIALVVGVLLLGAMAWRLLRQVGSPAADAAKDNAASRNPAGDRG